MPELPAKKPRRPAGRKPAGAEYSKSFDASQAVLFEELELAIRWGRPSILLAVYRSQDWQRRAEEALSERLAELGQKVVLVQAAEQPDVAKAIAQFPDQQHTVFFISGMENAGERNELAVYDGLNLNREFFVENRIRIVFWLTEKEALELPRYAPDFWAFRHRVVEFTRPQTARQRALPAGVLLWHTAGSPASGPDLQSAIRLREKMLADLPQRAESLSSRLDLLYTLARLYWSAGEARRAEELLATGRDLLGVIRIPLAESRLREGLAIVDYDLGRFPESLEGFKQLAEDNPRDALCSLNSGVAHHALGHNRDALELGDQAVALDPKNPGAWNGLGHLHYSLGETEPAIAAFRNALELEADNPAYHYSLAACYRQLGRPEEAIKQAEAAGGRSTLGQAFAEVLRGDEARAIQLLKAGLESRKISASLIRRDPNIGIYFDDAQVSALLGGT